MSVTWSFEVEKLILLLQRSKNLYSPCLGYVSKSTSYSVFPTSYFQIVDFKIS